VAYSINVQYPNLKKSVLIAVTAAVTCMYVANVLAMGAGTVYRSMSHSCTIHLPPFLGNTMFLTVTLLKHHAFCLVGAGNSIFRLERFNSSISQGTKLTWDV